MSSNSGKWLAKKKKSECVTTNSLDKAEGRHTHIIMWMQNGEKPAEDDRTLRFSEKCIPKIAGKSV